MMKIGGMHAIRGFEAERTWPNTRPVSKGIFCSRITGQVFAGMVTGDHGVTRSRRHGANTDNAIGLFIDFVTAAVDDADRFSARQHQLKTDIG